MSEDKDTRIKQLEAENEELKARNKRIEDCLVHERTRVADLIDANERLEQWKAEANTIFTALDLQAIGNEINAPLGQDIAPHVLPAIQELKRKLADYKGVLDDHKRLVRELDVALLGDKAATQASLCDIVCVVKSCGYTTIPKEEFDALLAKVREEGKKEGMTFCPLSASGKKSTTAVICGNHTESDKLIAKIKEEGRKEAVPEGWQVVPKEASSGMVDAAVKINWVDSDVRGNCYNQWQAMLSAAPKPQG